MLFFTSPFQFEEHVEQVWRASDKHWFFRTFGYGDNDCGIVIRGWRRAGNGARSCDLGRILDKTPATKSYFAFGTSVLHDWGAGLKATTLCFFHKLFPAYRKTLTLGRLTFMTICAWQRLVSGEQRSLQPKSIEMLAVNGLGSLIFGKTERVCHDGKVHFRNWLRGCGCWSFAQVSSVFLL